MRKKNIALVDVTTGKQLQELRMNLFRDPEKTTPQNLKCMSRTDFEKMMREILPTGVDTPYGTKIAKIEDNDEKLPQSWMDALPKLVTKWEKTHGEQSHITKEGPAKKDETEEKPEETEVNPEEKPEEKPEERPEARPAVKDDKEEQGSKALQKDVDKAVQVEQVAQYHVLGTTLSAKEAMLGVALLLKDPELTISRTILDDLTQGKMQLSKDELLGITALVEFDD